MFGKVLTGLAVLALAPSFALACGSLKENPSPKMTQQLQLLSQAKLTCFDRELGTALKEKASVQIVAKYKCPGSPVQGVLKIGNESDVITAFSKTKGTNQLLIITATEAVKCDAKLDRGPLAARKDPTLFGKAK